MRWNNSVVRFGLVGAAGFVVDASVVQALAIGAGFDLYLSRVVSYLMAATTTWWLNRLFTFRSKSIDLISQWLRFLAFNLSGGAINYAVYALLISMFVVAEQNPVAAVAAGSLAGMLVNYIVSRVFVFRVRNLNEA
jgi:putative flippase GtrA